MKRSDPPSKGDGKPVGAPMDAKSPHDAGVTGEFPWVVARRLQRQGRSLKKRELKRMMAEWYSTDGNGQWAKRRRIRNKFNALAERERDMTPRLVRR